MVVSVRAKGFLLCIGRGIKKGSRRKTHRFVRDHSVSDLRRAIGRHGFVADVPSCEGKVSGRFDTSKRGRERGKKTNLCIRQRSMPPSQYPNRCESTVSTQRRLWQSWSSSCLRERNVNEGSRVRKGGETDRCWRPWLRGRM